MLDQLYKLETLKKSRREGRFGGFQESGQIARKKAVASAGVILLPILVASNRPCYRCCWGGWGDEIECRGISKWERGRLLDEQVRRPLGREIVSVS